MKNTGRLPAFMAALAFACAAILSPAAAQNCGALVTLSTHDGTSARYGISGDAATAKAAIVLLAGGGGHVALDDGACPRQLVGNSLIRKMPLLHARGFVTALVDAPSDHQEEDGLGGFRIEAAHAEDIGKAIADVRKRTGLPVWLAGTSRGTISAANAASRLKGVAAPDGLILTSPVTSGFEGGRKAWVEQTVFSVDLGEIRIPLLVVAHADDKCIRTPPALSGRIAGKTASPRAQSVTVTGGPGWDGGENLRACRGKSPHGFHEQETEVTDGMVRFILGGRY